MDGQLGRYFKMHNLKGSEPSMRCEYMHWMFTTVGGPLQIITDQTKSETRMANQNK